jgi:hypothetical protein
VISIPDVFETVGVRGSSLESDSHDVQAIAVNTIANRRETGKDAGG